MHQNEDLQSHNQHALTYFAYLQSGEFVEAVFENWQSEFLAVGSLLVLSVYLRQRGSPESKTMSASNKRLATSYSLSASRLKAINKSTNQAKIINTGSRHQSRLSRTRTIGT